MKSMMVMSIALLLRGRDAFDRGDDRQGVAIDILARVGALPVTTSLTERCQREAKRSEQSVGEHHDADSRHDTHRRVTG
jgi:hypothetical protein